MSSTSLLTTNDIRDQFSLKDTNTVRRLVTNQGLPAHRIANRLLFDPSEVDAWVRSQRSGDRVVQPAAEPTENARNVPDPGWIAEQVARFTPDDLRRAASLLSALASGNESSPPSTESVSE